MAPPWRFLQYDDQHQVAGIAGDVDHDVFAGDTKALDALLAPARRRPHRLRRTPARGWL